MSVFNALSTAVSGINAQSTAFTNLSNNIANSQTVGYKADSTAFQNYVAGSLVGGGGAGDISQTVSAITVQHLDKQGTVSSSNDSLALAIAGNGLFNVSKASGQATSGTTTFAPQQYFTRNGEFYENKSGYLVNTSGYYLDGYMVDPSTGTINHNLTQVNVANVSFRPTETTTLTMTGGVGRLPASLAESSYTPQSYSTPAVTAYSSNGQPFDMGLTWKQSSTNPLTWTVSAYAYSATSGHTATVPESSSSATVTFDSNGTLKNIVDSSGHTISGAGSKASISVPVQYDGGVQNITLNLGTIGSTSGTVLTSSTSNPNVSGVASLSVANGDISVGSPTKIGTATGVDQNYMTSPVAVGSKGDYTSAKWLQTSSAPPTWTVQMVNPYTNTTQSGLYHVVFKPDGTVSAATDANGNSVTLNDLSATIGGQSYKVDLSNMSLSTDASLSTDTSALTTDSVATGNFEGVEITSDGSIMAQFDNGDTQLVAKLALTNFQNVNGLNAVDGQAYTATAASGNAETGVAGDNGTGSLSVGQVESSTTDLTSDLSALIVAQEAYTANTKVVTTADDLLQATISMKQS